MSGARTVGPVVLRSYLRQAARVVGARVREGEGPVVAVVGLEDWSVRLRIEEGDLVATVCCIGWGSGDEDLLFRSCMPEDVVRIGKWAERHAANVLMLLEATRAGEAERRGRLRLLLVDDERIAQSSILRMLRDHDVDLASCAEDARAQLAGPPYDGVLLDVSMPGESGVELLQHLWVEKPAVAARVCLITADPDLAPDRSTPLLTKPFTEAELAGVLRWFRVVADEDVEDATTPPTLCPMCGRGHRADVGCAS